MELLHFVGVVPLIVKTSTTGLGANVEMDTSARLVTKFIAVKKKMSMLSFTGGEVHQIAVLIALTAILAMSVYYIVNVVIVVDVEREVKFFVGAKPLLPWLS